MRGLVLICCIGLVLGGCKLSEPTFDAIQDLRMISGPKGELGMEIAMKITNPNNFGFVLKKIQAEILANNAVIGKVWAKKRVSVKKQSSDFHTITLLTNGKKLTTDITQLTSLFSGNPSFQVKGSVIAQACLWRKRFSFDQNTKMPRGTFQIPGF